MDLLELARTIQADRTRFIEEASRRRRLLDRSEPALPAGTSRAASPRDVDPGRTRQGSIVGGSVSR